MWCDAKETAQFPKVKCNNYIFKQVQPIMSTTLTFIQGLFWFSRWVMNRNSICCEILPPAVSLYKVQAFQSFLYVKNMLVWSSLGLIHLSLSGVNHIQGLPGAPGLKGESGDHGPQVRQSIPHHQRSSYRIIYLLIYHISFHYRVRGVSKAHQGKWENLARE